MYIFDPTAAWVQAHIALLEYPVVKKEVYNSVLSDCLLQAPADIRAAQQANSSRDEVLAKIEREAKELEEKNTGRAAKAITDDEGSSTVADAASSSFSR
jgi:hypothetical protein